MRLLAWIASLASGVILLWAPGSARFPQRQAGSVGAGGVDSPPQVLREGETIRFPLPGPTSTSAREQCDPDGDIYLVYSAVRPAPGPGPIMPPSVEGLPITKLSLDSETNTEFTPPALNGYRPLVLSAWSVDSFGRLYGLYSAHALAVEPGVYPPLRYFVVRYDEDGGVDTTVKLAEPPLGQFDPANLAAFSDGNLLLTGFFHPPIRPASPQEPRVLNPRAAPHMPAGFRPFTEILDSGGRLVQEVSLPEDVGPSDMGPISAAGGNRTATSSAARHVGDGLAPGNPLESPPAMRWATAVMDSLVVAGPENTVYILRSSSPPTLYTLASDGRVVHRVQIEAYRGHAIRPTNMSSAGEAGLLVDFYELLPRKGGGFLPSYMFAMVDPDTGKITASYRLPKGSNLSPACADGPNDFLFIGWTKDGKLEVVKYSGH